MSHIPYAIGLDLGTSSTGYAMTDMNGQLLKHQKRSTFGAVLFDAAKTAAERRGHRSARRRLDRREQRINLLQALMQTEIEKIDPDFFLRLNESFLQEDERRYPLLYGTLPVSIWTDGSPFVMPDGKPLLDANGKARTYPTIYHLRDALIRTDKQADIRYVYLAMHHIIKYRGHFLLENQSLESENTDVKKAIREALQALSDDPLNNQLNMDDTVVEEVFSLLQDQQGSRSNRADKLVSCLKPAPSSKPAVKAFANLLVGNKGSLKALCGYDDETPAEKLSLAQEDLDVEAYVNALGVHSNLFQQMVQIYRWQLFSGLREPGKTISQTMQAQLQGWISPHTWR